MRRSTASSRWIRWVVAALLAFTTTRLARASCSAGPDFGQLLPNCGGGYCYVVSPGLHTSQSLAGSFWSFASGNPAIGPGNDNGAWPVGSWLVPYGSNLYFGGAWHSSTAIDGCITGSVAPGKPAEIMVALFSDEGYSSFFAISAVRRMANSFPEFDFTFAAGGGPAHDIDLVELPRAHIQNFTSPDIFEFVSPNLGEVSFGVYGDGSVTAAELAKGYRVYTRPNGATSFRTSAGWTPITGIVPLGQNVVVEVPWNYEVHFAYTLVFDGDFETAHVGRDVTMRGLPRCEVPPWDTDGDGYWFWADPGCAPNPAMIDCNDGNPSVHPGALEVCNGIDDNCNGAVDDVAIPGSVALGPFEKLPGTTGIDWPALAVATRYDLVRGDLTTLLASGGSYSEATQTCVADDLGVNHADDPLDPAPDSGFWYLARAANCTGVGSFDAPDATQAAPRDAGIAASGHSCP